MLCRSSLLAAFLVCACAPIDEEGSLYEEDPGADLGGKADGTGLTPTHAVDSYETILEARVAEAPLTARTFLSEWQIPARAGIVVLRSFLLDGEPTFVVADDRTFELGLVPAADLEQRTVAATSAAASSFRYLKALARTKTSVLCELQKGAAPSTAVRFTLTIDMCQSRREWEGELFEWLAELGEQRGEATPVGVAMTGLWAHRHADEFQKIASWQRAGLLDVQWVNHSYRHQLSRDAAGVYHFLTAPSVSLTDEVVDLEVLLLGQGIMFSPLFRFPGLTHDERTLVELAGLGLFPLDANAWVAKGEPIDDGSVVLLHGNGNESVGVDMFFDWTDPRADLFARGDIRLADSMGVLPVPGEGGELPGLDSFTTCAP